jgi:hypothetical protein
VPRPESWAIEEVEAIVADYFAMLEKELSGIPYSKTEHQKALRPLLRDRSVGSIGRKHSNISAILIEQGFPPIRGYKPLFQYQGLLKDIVLEYLDDDAKLSALALRFVDREPEAPLVHDVLGLMTKPPDILESVREALKAQRERRYPRRIDYLALEARNRILGTNGEALVVSYERARLSSIGRDNLADRVEQVSVTRGDGLGYDVLSFDDSARELYIEVKTTQLGATTPFYITPAELSFSAEHADDYALYRVYEFASAPRMFPLHGDVGTTCEMTPAQFMAVPRAR